MPEFCHLHCHTQFSLLDGASGIDAMMKKAKADGQKAVAITDHGNMFGAFKFWASANKNGVKPILGCEFYLVEDRFQKKFSKIKKDKRYHQLLLAKNKKGYENLSKLCSLGFIEGLYSKYPRIDKELLKQYKEGLIATSCCIGAEVPQTILFKGEEEGEKVFKEWLDIFGDDYYIEIQRHGLKNIDDTGWDQEGINQVLLKWAEKYGVKVIATNDSHYIEQDDFEAHDILLCINTGDYKSTPKGYGKGYRFGFPNDQFYFKTAEEMYQLFKDVPHSLETTIEIAEKIETPKLKRDVLMPNYVIPEGFKTQDDYLKHLSFEGARRKYKELTSEVSERIEMELNIIKDMGFSGYFLIVQDFIKAAKDLNVAVGPGRGSAAGSAVAFCTDITNIDPIGYNLLFERFLNPERVSMPDIDIDFDDEGRQKVIDYVVDKYGQNQVAQIVTYGTMAAKSSIRDVGRVMELPLPETDTLAKLIPEGPKVSLAKAFKEVPELKEIRKDEDRLQGKILKMAETLEGSVRHRGIHAAGVIIAPGDLTNYIPVCTSKDSDLWVTQFDGKYIEDAGMLKMDFLGLKTLSILKEAVKTVERTKGVKIDIDNIPLDDQPTLELYQRGETIGTFQFESGGMRKYLQDLKPSNLEDLIAMNALYRPGPMDYIPTFVNRKHGKEKVVYPHPLLEGILKPTYGIMVYQEQIMQTAQIIGGFSLGQADILRRAMGKKKMEVMQEMKAEFVKGAAVQDIDEKKANEIFEIMEKFAAYGFNRSHSAAYSVVAFQTAYMKANFPAEYMAAVLSFNMNDISKITFFMNEANRMGIKTLGPDINESDIRFNVNEKGQIRFALSAIKGVGEAAVQEIINVRNEGGNFKHIFDMTKRVNLRTVNKKSVECLAIAGAFDAFGPYRSQYFHLNTGDKLNLLEKAAKLGASYQNKGTQQATLFGAEVMEQIEEPPIPDCEPWPMIELLKKEREVTGIYLSGHPLDQYKISIDNFCNATLDQLEQMKNRDNICVGAMVMEASHRTSKTGKSFGLFNIEDYKGTTRLALFGEDYLKYRHFFMDGELLWIQGRMEKRWNSDEQEFRVSNVRLLSDIINSARNITIELDLMDVKKQLIDEIESLCSEKKGGINVRFQIKDNGYVLNMFSTQYKMFCDKALFDRLRKKSIKFSVQK